MKKAVGIFIALFMVVSLQPATAQATDKTIVIIDNGIDSAVPEFSGKLIYEVCRTVSGGQGSCPNGTGSQEGSRSAIVSNSTKEKHHGTKMALVALSVNPDAKIIFIRTGRVVSNRLQEDLRPAALEAALKWVSDNRSKFNIIAVSASIGNDLYDDSSCPVSTSTNKTVVDNIISLTNLGIPVFAAVGNNTKITVRRNNRLVSETNNKVAFPACIPQAISVGAVNRFSSDDGWKLSNATSLKSEKDFVALGSFNGINGIFGESSPATAALAAYYVKNYKGSSIATFDFFKSVVKPSPANFVDVLG
jgi:hypothetical protein